MKLKTRNVGEEITINKTYMIEGAISFPSMLLKTVPTRMFPVWFRECFWNGYAIKHNLLCFRENSNHLVKESIESIQISLINGSSINSFLPS